MIGGAVFMFSTVNLVKEENEALDIVYSRLVEQRLIASLSDVFNFDNFNRDGTITLHDF
jgi:hypothetical protein